MEKIWYCLAIIAMASAIAYTLLNTPLERTAKAPVEECISACKTLSAQGIDVSKGVCIFSDMKGYSCAVVRDCRSFKEGKTGQILLNASCSVVNIQERPV